MKLSEYIEYLQRLLNKNGDADIYQLGECGEYEEPGYIETQKNSYYDLKKDKLIESVNCYLIH